jgi:predicted nucleotidyltransferase
MSNVIPTTGTGGGWYVIYPRTNKNAIHWGQGECIQRLQQEAFVMITKADILSVLRNELSYINEKYGVKNIGLFGSYSRGDQTAESDIDLLVEFGKPIGLFKFIALEDYLGQKLGAKVELVTEDALKSIIRPYVTKEVVYV